MKLSRRQFLKGGGAAAVGGLLLSRPEALAHPSVSAEDKKAIQRHPSRPQASIDAHGIEQGPEYVLWQGRLYYVTDWQRNLRMGTAEVVSWDDPDNHLIVHSAPSEELRLGAILLGEET